MVVSYETGPCFASIDRQRLEPRTHLAGRVDVGFLALSPVLEPEAVVDDRLDFSERLFDLASQEEAGHGHLPGGVLLDRV